MKFVLKLALKNVIRDKRRSLFTLIILSCAIAYNILIWALFEGIAGNSIENLIQFETGHFKIRSKNYDPENPYKLNNFLTNPENIMEKLSNFPFVRAFTQRIQFLGEMDNGEITYPCNIVGIDPTSDSKVFHLMKFFGDGKLSENKAVVGKQMADRMELKKNDEVYITFRNKDGAIDSTDFILEEIIETQDPEVNHTNFFISLDKARELLGNNNVTEISLLTDNHEKCDAYQKPLTDIFPDLQVKSWKQLGKDIIQHKKLDMIINSVFVFFIVLIALVGLVNTMIMSILEKKKEIGTLKALGMRNQDILVLFVTEGAFLGLIGGIIGVFLGFLINWYMVEVGLDFTQMLGKRDVSLGYKMFGTLKSPWCFDVMGITFVLNLILCMIASYFPARKAVLLNPVDCLREIN